MGPTASGKSGVAMQLTRRLPVEIVSVDSALVYRHMDIGTAKPDLDSRLKVRHHLIDVIEPTENYSAAQFRVDALEIMADIVERGRVPLLTGGTMLYFKALREGLSELPAANEDTRLVIDAMAADVGWPAIHRELERIDPVTSQRLDPNDSQRIQRAMEIFYLTGKPMSELIAAGKPVELPYRLISLALVPGKRGVLHQRIADRFEFMLELGLINEVRELREDYDLKPDLPSMRCVGYRQVWQYLDGEYGLGVLREKAVAATRQLAKRQLTWLRATRDVRQFDCLAGDLQEQVEAWLAEQLER
ncbi:MAG TPA: tRNA (adenosine(37)-N6)-dimethylallyltransferase MiaA [Burkholderiales bacterium]|nr:tRNA (adenosine(37)-N6)-dimethylallyltransferase MiaA [Burkholderiales bacterium]